MRRALYAGSFDPPTLGHLWVTQAGLKVFDEVVVAVGFNPDKQHLFPASERAELFQRSLEDAGADLSRLRVTTYTGRFTVDVARSEGAGFLLRGIRGHDDLEHERTMRIVNGDLAPELTTVLLMPPREIAHLSSSFVRGLRGLERWEDVAREMVPPRVLAAL